MTDWMIAWGNPLEKYTQWISKKIEDKTGC